MDWLESSSYRNSHGYGFMAPRGDGRVFAFRSDGTPPLKHLKLLLDKHPEAAVHFRFSTRGPKDKANAHPFPVLKKKHHGEDLYVMHNGTFPFTTKGDVSDTSVLVYRILRPLLAKDPDRILDPAFQELLQAACGKNSKLLFCRGKDGKFVWINKSETTDKDGFILANTYSLFHGPTTTTYSTSSWRNQRWDSTQGKWVDKEEGAVSASSSPTTTTTTTSVVSSASAKAAVVAGTSECPRIPLGVIDGKVLFRSFNHKTYSQKWWHGPAVITSEAAVALRRSDRFRPLDLLTLQSLEKQDTSGEDLDDEYYREINWGLLSSLSYDEIEEECLNNSQGMAEFLDTQVRLNAYGAH